MMTRVQKIYNTDKHINTTANGLNYQNLIKKQFLMLRFCVQLEYPLLYIILKLLKCTLYVIWLYKLLVQNY